MCQKRPKPWQGSYACAAYECVAFIDAARLAVRLAVCLFCSSSREVPHRFTINPVQLHLRGHVVGNMRAYSLCVSHVKNNQQVRRKGTQRFSIS